MAKPDISKYTGAVNINADITPITRVKIEQVTKDKWPLMDTSALWDQRIILTNRMIAANQAGHMEIAKQINVGVAQLDALLQKKSDEEEQTADHGIGTLI